MFKAYHIALIAGLVVVGGGATFSVDYYVQAKSATERGESYDLAAYADSVRSRLDAHAESSARKKEQKAAKAEGILAQYPPAPQGWSVRDWEEADIARLNPPTELTEAEIKIMEAASIGPLGRAEAKAREMAEAARAAETRVYNSGEEFIALQVSRLKDNAPSGVMGNAMALAMAKLTAQQEGFAVVQGVAYRKHHGSAADRKAGIDIYRAEIGNAYAIELRALASGEDVFDIITGINYDRLNAMLEETVAGIGSHVPTAPFDQQKAIAEAYEADRYARIQDEGADAEAAFAGVKGSLRTAGATPSAKSGGSVMTKVTGWIGGDDEAEETPEVKVNRLGGGGAKNSGGCEMVGAMKRCRIGQD